MLLALKMPDWLTAYGWLGLPVLLVVYLLLLWRRPAQAVFPAPTGGDGGRSWLGSLLASQGVLIPLALLMSLGLASWLVLWIDDTTRQQVQDDATKVVREAKTTARQRLANRCADLLQKVHSSSADKEIPPPVAQARLLARELFNPARAAPVDDVQKLALADALKKWQEPTSENPWWAVLPVVETQPSKQDKRTGLDLLSLIQAELDAEDRLDGNKEDEARKKRLEILTASLGDKITTPDGMQQLRRLYGKNGTLGKGDILDLGCFFTFGDTVQLQESTVAFLLDPWAFPLQPGDESLSHEDRERRNILYQAVVGVYADLRPTTEKPQTKTRWRHNLDRLGTAYKEPVPKDVLVALAAQLGAGGKSDLPKLEQRRLSFLLAATLVPRPPGLDPEKPAPPLTLEEYDFPGLSLQDILKKKMFSHVQEGICTRVETYSSGDRHPFTLGVTWIRARAICRGPIQLATFVLFLWGMLVLITKNLLLDLLPPWSDSLLSTLRRQVQDRFAVRWKEIWLCRVGPVTDPVTRQLVEARGRPRDLFSFLLRRLLLAMHAGSPADDAAGVIDRAAEDWKKEHAHEDLFFDFLSYAIPSLGFFGTIFGIAQGMATTNRVLTPDPELQVNMISYMTSQLSSAFYATLLALGCAIPFTLAYYLVTWLRERQTRRAKQLARTFLARCVEWSLPIQPSPTRPLGELAQRLPPASGHVVAEAEAELRLFLCIAGSLAGEVCPNAVLLGCRQPDVEQQLPRPWLGHVLVHTRLLSHDEWLAEYEGAFAYSRLWELVQRLPPQWRGLGEVLYWREVRPINAELAALGLQRGLVEGSVTLSDGQMLETILTSIAEEHAGLVLPRDIYDHWRKLCHASVLKSRETLLGRLPHAGLSEQELGMSFAQAANWVMLAPGRGSRLLRVLALYLPR